MLIVLKIAASACRRSARRAAASSQASSKRIVTASSSAPLHKADSQQVKHGKGTASSECAQLQTRIRRAASGAAERTGGLLKALSPIPASCSRGCSRHDRHLVTACVEGLADSESESTRIQVRMPVLMSGPCRCLRRKLEPSRRSGDPQAGPARRHDAGPGPGQLARSATGSEAARARAPPSRRNRGRVTCVRCPSGYPRLHDCSMIKQPEVARAASRP